LCSEVGISVLGFFFFFFLSGKNLCIPVLKKSQYSF